MSYTFDNYHHLGMENFDGGDDRWDFNHDGEMSIFEENSRRAYDQVMFDNIFGEDEKVIAVICIGEVYICQIDRCCGVGYMEHGACSAGHGTAGHCERRISF